MSELKSATASEVVPLPAGIEGPSDWNPPLAWRSSTEIVPAVPFAVARSGRPSRSKSAATTSYGAASTLTGEPISCVKLACAEPMTSSVMDRVASARSLFMAG